MYNSYNELLYDCTNRIQIYVSDSNVENAEKEQIIAAFSNELTKFLIDSEEIYNFDIDYLIRSVSLRVVDDSLSTINRSGSLSYDECEKGIALCKRQRDNIFQFQNHPNWTMLSLKCNIDECERAFITQKNNIENQRIKAEKDADKYKYLGRNFEGDESAIKRNSNKSDFKTSLKKFF